MQLLPLEKPLVCKASLGLPRANLLVVQLALSVFTYHKMAVSDWPRRKICFCDLRPPSATVPVRAMLRKRTYAVERVRRDLASRHQIVMASSSIIDTCAGSRSISKTERLWQHVASLRLERTFVGVKRSIATAAEAYASCVDGARVPAGFYVVRRHARLLHGSRYLRARS